MDDIEGDYSDGEGSGAVDDGSNDSSYVCRYCKHVNTRIVVIIFYHVLQ